MLHLTYLYVYEKTCIYFFHKGFLDITHQMYGCERKFSVTRLMSSILRTYTPHITVCYILILWRRRLRPCGTLHKYTIYTTGGFIIFMRKFIYFLKDKRKNRVFTHICVWYGLCIVRNCIYVASVCCKLL